MPLVVYKSEDVRRTRGPWWLDAIETEAVGVAPPLQGDVLVVTSVNDGRHRADSLHYEDRAIDLRFTGERPGAILVQSAHLTPEKLLAAQRLAAERWAARLRRRLGDAFDIVVEADHLHVEYDPETG